MVIILATFIVLITIYLYRFYTNVKRYPRGPTPFPIIGNLHTIVWSRAHIKFAELSKEYGPVFTIWMPRPYVCIMDYEHLKEAFLLKGNDFSGRAKFLPDIAFQVIENGGIVFSDGDNWREQRRASLHILRDFGMGKNLMEQQVSTCMQECLVYINSLKDNFEAIDLKWPMQFFAGNVVTQTMYNFRYKHTDFTRLRKCADLLDEQFALKKKSKIVLLAQVFPWINRIPFLSYQRKAIKGVKAMHQIGREDVDNALKSFDYYQDPECFVHAYKRMMTHSETLTYEQLVNVALDISFAGIEITSTTLQWAILYLAAYPEMQDKLRNEVLTVVGEERMVTVNEKPLLPYASAFINEVQRCCNMVPLNVAHRTVRDTSVGRYSIPADTMIFGVLANVLLNSPVYQNGEEFNPDRFLMSDGKTPNKEALEHLIPFSIGKRQCAGEGMARMELFIGIVTLVQHYKFEPRPAQVIDLTPVYTAVTLPTRQLIQVKPIHKR